MLTDKIGIDLGPHPLAAGRAQAAAELGAKVARLHFGLVAGGDIDAAALAAARAAADAVQGAGLRVVAVVGPNLTVAPSGLGAFESPPPSAPLAAAWERELIDNAGRLAAALGDTVYAWELLPEPNGEVPIASDRWAEMVGSVAAAIRQVSPRARLITGGIRSDMASDGIDYLHGALVHARERRLWEGDRVVDSVGLVLDVHPGEATEAEVSTTVRDRIQRLRSALGMFGGTDVPITVTAIGWDAARLGAELQARNLWAAFNQLTGQAGVAVAVWRGCVDEGVNHYGLFRSDPPSGQVRRPAAQAFKDFAIYARQITPVPDFSSAAGLAAWETTRASGGPLQRATSESRFATLGAAAEPLVPEPDLVAPSEAPSPARPSAEVVLHIPSAAEILSAQGLSGPGLELALAALTDAHGPLSALPPGVYRAPLPLPPALGAGIYTNQDVMTALYRAGEGTWSLLQRAGLDLADLAGARDGLYSGPAVESLPNLSDSELGLVLEELAAAHGARTGGVA